jgi:hypothetical protein
VAAAVEQAERAVVLVEVLVEALVVLMGVLKVHQVEGPVHP